MATKDILNAILAGQSVDAQTELNSVLLDKIKDHMDSMKQDIAQSMFVSKDDSSINEKLESDASQEDYIKDFLSSDDPRFKDKSKKEKIQMALAAFYANKKK